MIGKGADYTAKHKPIKIAYYEIFNTKEEAVAREKYFKSGIGREWLNKRLAESDLPDSGEEIEGAIE